MKNILFILFVFFTLASHAKFYNGKITYKDGKTEDVQISMPIKANAKSIKIKKNNVKEKVDSEKIENFSISFDDESHYVFKQVGLAFIGKNGELKVKNKLRGWGVINRIYDHSIIYSIGIKYSSTKINGKDGLLITYNLGLENLVMGKSDEDIFFFISNSFQNRMKKDIKIVESYLFDKCSNFSEIIDFDRFKKMNYVFALAEQYDECVNQK